MKKFKWTNTLTVALSIFAMVLGIYAAFQNETKTTSFDSDVLDLSSIPTYQRGSVSQSEHLPFDWKVYEDLENPEFWDDGGQIPPRPYRYAAAHPTKENVKRLLAWLSKQGEAVSKLQSMMMEAEVSEKTTAKNDRNFNTSNLFEPFSVDESMVQDVKIAYIYSATCPACANQAPIIQKLSVAGADVSWLQTDHKKGTTLEPGSTAYVSAFAKTFPHSVTPTMYLKVGKSTVRKVEGFVPGEKLVQLINTIREETKGEFDE